MESDEQLEEERRLCYVGITRAKIRLYITYALQRIMYGKTESKVISDFVKEIPKEYVTRIDDVIRRPQRDNYSSLPFGLSDDFGSFSYGSEKVGLGGKSSLMSDAMVSSIISSSTFKGSDAPAVSDTYSKGERVSHKKFGEGMIVGVTDMGGDYQLEISFDNVGTRTLMASFAKLKKL